MSAALDSAPAPRRLLFISNGHGEDSIAAAIIRRLPRGRIVEAYPTIGAGDAYAGVCAIVGPRASLASQGWRNVRFSLMRDLANGGLATVWPGLKFLKRVHAQYDRIVVVGDVVGVAGCWAVGARDITYLDVYKTGHGRGYSLVERQVIKATCALAFCRHEALAKTLHDDGVDARFAGNVMMDAIPFGDYSPQRRRIHKTAVTLLPGSRKLTLESFALQIEALRRLPVDRLPDIFLAVAGGVAIDDLAKAGDLHRSGPLTGEAGDLGTLSGGRIIVHMATGALGNLLAASNVVLSQAGTATIQALGSGLPVITFRNSRDRNSRFRDESALFGEARIVTAADAEAVSRALLRLLDDPEERLRLGAIGQNRIGGPGGMQAVVEALVD